MGVHTVPMRTFLDTMDKWIDAVNGRRTEQAKYYVKELGIVGQMLASDPEFKAIFHSSRTSCADTDPEQVLTCMSEFLEAVTNAGRPGAYRPGRPDTGDHTRPGTEIPSPI
jgi:hypothetical protein